MSSDPCPKDFVDFDVALPLRAARRLWSHPVQGKRRTGCWMDEGADELPERGYEEVAQDVGKGFARIRILALESPGAHSNFGCSVQEEADEGQCTKSLRSREGGAG